MSREWIRLDNVAKIFPSADGGADNQVFRFSCEMKEPVDSEILQQSLNETLEIFDIFRYIMKRGIFWYYLEKTDLTPVVRKEYKPPCAPIYNRDKKNLLFEVTYFNNRINLEVYHVLCDGTGAMHFLKTLVTKYICKKYDLEEIPIDYDASKTQMKDDSFAKYYSDSKKHKKKKFKTACKLKGQKFSENRLKVITGHVSLNEVLKLSHEYNVTLTAFICSCFIEAIGAEISNRSKKKDVVISVPVNLRNFFPSASARNFFSLITTSYNFSKNESNFNKIINKTGTDIKEKLTAENLAENINTFSAIEHNFFAKIAPLRMKDFCLRRAYKISMLERTATVSNIGPVTMPEQTEKYIKAFDIYTGTNLMQICLCSYKDILSISFTSPFVSTDIQRRFFRKLTEMGVNAEIFANLEEGEN